jgi:adenine phosphoribosyltransferase
MVNGMVAYASSLSYRGEYPVPKGPPMDLTKYIRDVPDFPKPGILFKDITPLLAVPAAFRQVIDTFANHYGARVDCVAAAEARGFLFAAPLALQLNRPLIPLRKPGKLPHTSHRVQYDLEYGSAELHVHIDAIGPGDRVLLLDDLLATGGTLEAGIKLVEKAGGRVAGIGCLVELLFLKGRERLKPHEVFSLIQY